MKFGGNHEQAKVKNNIYLKMSIALLMLYFYANAFTLAKVYGNTLIAIFSVFIAVVLFVVGVRFKGKVTISNLIMTLLLSGVVLFRNKNFSTGDYYSDVVFLLIMIIWLLGVPGGYIYSISQIMITVGFVFALMTIVFYFSRDLYSTYLQYAFPDRAYTLLRNFDKGYIYGLSRSSAFNSGYILFGLSALVIRIWGQVEKKKTADYLILVVFFVALLLTVKRNAILFGVGSLMIVYLLQSKRKDRFGKILISVAGVAILIGFLSEFIPGVTEALEKTIFQNQEGDISNGRFYRFIETITVFRNNPLFGVGWGSMRANAESVFSGVDSAHNVYLQLLAETGIVGFSIFTVYFIYNIVIAIRLIKYDISNNILKCEIMFSLFVQLYFLLYSLTGNPLYDAVYYIIYFISCSFTSLIWKNRSELLNL